MVLLSRRYFPKAVLSGATALKLHGLVDIDLARIEADIPKSTSQRSHLIAFSRVSPARIIEVETIEFAGSKIQVYSAERALADCLLKKLDKKLFAKALKNYIARGAVDSDRIAVIDKALGTDLRARVDSALLKTVYTPEPEAPAPMPVSEADRLLGAAILVYARVGGSDLNFRLVADEAGVSVPEVTAHFHNKTRLKQAILEALRARIIQTAAKPLPASAYNRQWLVENIAAFFAMSEMDEIGYRIQRWIIAEQNTLTKDILQLCSQLIRGISHVIVSEVEGIDFQTAEGRASILVAILDSFANLKWYYADLLEIECGRKEIVQNYKRSVWACLDGLLFAPASAESKVDPALLRPVPPSGHAPER